jgi:signal peptidase I
LSFRVAKWSGSGALLVELNDGQRRFTAAFDLERKRLDATIDDLAVPVAAYNMGLLVGRPFLFEASLVDQQFLVAVDGRVLVEHPYRRSRTASPGPRPVAIGAAGPQLEIDQVRLYRDVFYTHPIGVRARWGIERPYRLQEDEYFVLGDNSPASDDSRSWPAGPGVRSEMLLGRPLAVLFSAHPVEWLGWRFQLPAPSRIRYIR